MTTSNRPIRTCVACRRSGDKKELLRIVRNALGSILIDPTGKAPGRGAYLCRRGQCVAAAIKKKSLERALRTVVPAELVENLIRAVQENENGYR